MGKRGSGKTKQIIELVNQAAADDPGSVVCVEKGQKLRYDVKSAARLIDISEYPVRGYNGVLGFVCGIYAENYDVNQIFLDSLYKISEDSDIEHAEAFLDVLAGFAETHGVTVTITISDDIENATEGIKRFIT